jgi:hypothetical protein
VDDINRIGWSASTGWSGRHGPDYARRPGEEQKRVNVDFPVWMIAALDREAKHIGVTRQSIIKMWLAEHLHGTH